MLILCVLQVVSSAYYHTDSVFFDERSRKINWVISYWNNLPWIWSGWKSCQCHICSLPSRGELWVLFVWVKLLPCLTASNYLDLISGWPCRITVWTVSMSHGGSFECLASFEEANTCILKVNGNHCLFICARPASLGGQLCTLVWVYLWIFIIICSFTICIIWALWPPKKDSTDLCMPRVLYISVFSISCALLCYSCLWLWNLYFV